MELVVIGFVGTALLMAAELRDFARRGRSTAVTLDTSSTLPRPSTKAKSWAEAHKDFYDKAA
jgi:hypothetical protein